MSTARLATRGVLAAGLIAATAYPVAAERPFKLGTTANAAAARPAGRPMVRPLRLAQAQVPLSLNGPLRAEAGTQQAFPVRLSAGDTFGKYVMVYRTPEWLSFDGGENIADGVWLLPKEQLENTKVVISKEAAGKTGITVAALKADGTISWQNEMFVEIVPPQATVTADAGTPETAPAAAGAEPAADPALEEPDLSSVAENAGGGVTWENIIGQSSDAAGPPAAAPPQQQVAAVRRRPPPQPQGPPKSEAELVQQAKFLVRECTTCHNLYGQDVGIPVMVGLTVDRFLDTMDLYRREKRDHKLMQSIAKSLSEEETRALALYLSRIKPATEAEIAAAAQIPAPVTAPPLTGAPPDAGAPAAAAGAPQRPRVAAQPPRRVADAATNARIVRWIDRSRTMLDNGDIAQARLLLKRGAEYGNADAAFLLASSFDPNALPWRSGMGLVAEPLKARRWYEYAKSLGATAADQRLAELPAPR